jgi:hypothetical protein
MDQSIVSFTVRSRWMQILIAFASYLGVMILMIGLFYVLLPPLGIISSDPVSSSDWISILIILLPPSVSFIVVLALQYKNQVMVTIDLLQVPAVRQLYGNTVKAWSVYRDKIVDGTLAQTGVPKDVKQCVVKFSPFEINAVKYLLNTCSIEPYEFIVSLIPNRDMILTNRRMLVRKGNDYEKITYDKINAYEKYTKGFSNLTLHFTSRDNQPFTIEGKYAPVKELFDFAYKMKDWSDAP